MASVFAEDADRRDTQRRGEGDVKTEVGTGVMQMRAKECPAPPEGLWPCQHPDFELLATRTGRE